MKAKLGWTDVLEAARKLAPEQGWAFTVDQIADALKIENADAARWVSKLVDWDYVRRGDFEPEEGRTPGRRPRRLYHMLKRGLEKQLGGQSDVDRLADAIQNLREAIGEVSEKNALQNLFKVHDQVVEDRENRFKKKE